METPSPRASVSSLFRLEKFVIECAVYRLGFAVCVCVRSKRQLVGGTAQLFRESFEGRPEIKDRLCW